jgi:glycosyltransferase involved in cell wall biosynthesis
MSDNLKVLFLSAWYPHRYDAMSGLFVRKHAQAVSRFAPVCVLFLYADESIKKFEIAEQNFENVREIYIYFPFCKNRFLVRISKGINYLRAFFKGFSYLKKTFGTPSVTVANVLTRSGVLALWLKRTQKIPYIVIEHWTRYLPENFNYKGFWRKIFTKIVVKNASAFIVVSELLKKAMQKLGLTHKNLYIVDNVVDDFFFESKASEKRDKKRFILVSCFSEKQKNVCGILDAVRKVAEQRDDFEFVIIGTGADFDLAKNYFKRLNFPENMVLFLGELPPEEVAKWLKNSDFSVIFSNYETYSVVIAESLSTGLPLISTPTGIAPDAINSSNGFLVPSDNKQALSEKINFLLDNFQNYDSLQIRDKAGNRFGFENVGKKIYEIINLHLKK